LKNGAKNPKYWVTARNCATDKYIAFQKTHGDDLH